jgi:hypothetical protein
VSEKSEIKVELKVHILSTQEVYINIPRSTLTKYRMLKHSLRENTKLHTMVTRECCFGSTIHISYDLVLNPGRCSGKLAMVKNGRILKY